MRRYAIVFLIITAMMLGLGSAWGEDRNEIGLYVDPDDLTSCSIQLTSPTVIQPYLVLTNPYDEETGTEIGAVWGFECRINAPPGDFVVGFNGTNSWVNILQAPEFIVAFASPVPVVDGQATLGYLSIITYAMEGSYYFMGPITNGPPSIPDMMAFSWPDEVTTDDRLSPMYPVSGSLEDPVFAVNGTVVPAASLTWGGVKALYR